MIRSPCPVVENCQGWSEGERRVHHELARFTFLFVYFKNKWSSILGEILYIFFLLYIYCWHYYRCPHSPLLCPPPLAPSFLPSDHHHTVVSVCGLCIYDFWLILSPSFIQFSPPPQLSACSMFPCVCIYFTGHETTKTHYQKDSFPMHCYSSNSLDLLN